MSDSVLAFPPTANSESLTTAGRQAALLIWQSASPTGGPEDPRRQEFSNAVVDQLSELLSKAPGIFQHVMKGAASAAEDLNVEPFQGLVEVIQNADDLFAS